MIIVNFGGGSLRFSEVKRSISGISQRMLTPTLRGLEREGLVNRTVLPTNPPRVDYELTALGRSLWQVVQPLGPGARAHRVEMGASRERFDKPQPLGFGRSQIEAALGEGDRSAPVRIVNGIVPLE